VIAAGIGDYAALEGFLGEGCDLVVGATQLERPDRLQILRLEIKLASVVQFVRLMDVRRNQPGTDGNAVQASLRGENVVERDDGSISA
jgi:hypothetical protein